MNTVNVPDIHIHQSFSNTEGEADNNVEANNPFISNTNLNFASM